MIHLKFTLARGIQGVIEERVANPSHRAKATVLIRSLRAVPEHAPTRPVSRMIVEGQP